MFTPFTKTALCSLVISVLMVTNAHAQLSSVFGGNNGGGNAGQNRQQPQQSMQQPGGFRNNPAPTANVVGQWYLAAETDEGQIEVMYVFNADTSMTLGVARTPRGGQAQTNKFTGRYQLSGNSIQIDYDDGDVENFRVESAGNELRLISTQDQSVMALTRVQGQGGNPGGRVTGGNPPVQPQRPMTQQNPHAGNWILSASGNDTTIQGQLNLNANGSYHLSMNVTAQGNTNQTAMAGQWRVEGSMIVFETDGEVERYPIQFDGQRLGIDLAEWGVRTVFARKAQQSYVEPLTGNNSGSNQGGGYQTGQYQGGQSYSGDMANRW